MNNITFVRGNIFNTKAQTIVNTVNCVGVMGKGIALVYKLRYPTMFDIYHNYCKQHLIGIGKLWLYKGDETDPWVLNFPTKVHWKYPSKLEYIEAGLKKFVETYQARGISSIAFPLLGTNNGGLDKQDVLELMVKYLSQCDIAIEIYEYNPLAPDDIFEKFRSKWLSIPYTDLKAITHIRQKKQIDTIEHALREDNLKSMISLISYPGIGLKTMECCFKLVMNYKKSATLFETIADN